MLEKVETMGFLASGAKIEDSCGPEMLQIIVSTRTMKFIFFCFAKPNQDIKRCLKIDIC
jgi:hypothetical protein